MLFNEPKLLKYEGIEELAIWPLRFSALQRAEIAEIRFYSSLRSPMKSFSALQRAEIAEI